MGKKSTPVARIWDIVRSEKTEISAIYFYAILAGLLQLTLPVGIQSIINFVLGGSMSASLVLLIVLVVGGVLITGLIYINQMKLIEKIQQKLFVRYSIDFADHVPRIDLQKADTFYLPELVNRFFEVPSLQKGLSKLLLDVPTATIQILFGMILLSLYHPAFIIFGLLLILVLALILYYSGTKGLQTSLAESTYKYKAAAWLEELARVVMSFKLSKGTQLHIRKQDEHTVNYLKARTEHFSILLFQYRLLVALKTIITTAMLVVGSFLLVNQQLNVGQFIAAEIVILIMIGAVEKIIGTLDSVYDVLTSVEKISKLTDKPVEEQGSLLTGSMQEAVSIELKKVGFRFSNSPDDIFKNLSFKIKAGEKVCIMGQEGSGKSTLLRLIAGTFSSFSGSLLIDGVPLQNYNLDAFRTRTGIYLSQQHIFHGSLLENITMGNDQFSLEEIKTIAGKLELTPFITSLKNGFDTELDPVGNQLPGNVIRKILVLRAMINKPALMLLEEPWHGFPEELKLNFQDLLLNHSGKSTLLIVSNDKDFASRCDKIIFLSGEDTRIINNKTTMNE